MIKITLSVTYDDREYRDSEKDDWKSVDDDVCEALWDFMAVLASHKIEFEQMTVVDEELVHADNLESFLRSCNEDEAQLADVPSLP